jgi:hypothetical protein
MRRYKVNPLLRRKFASPFTFIPPFAENPGSFGLVRGILCHAVGKTLSGGNESQVYGIRASRGIDVYDMEVAIDEARSDRAPATIEDLKSDCVSSGFPSQIR